MEESDDEEVKMERSDDDLQDSMSFGKYTMQAKP